MKKIAVFSALILIFSLSAFALEATLEVPALGPSSVTVMDTPKIITSEASPVKVAPKQEEKKPVSEIKYTGVKFKDVPEDHWASSSVYDLVNMGVTQGYPDGTFRGSNYITRYETAMFLSKLAASIGESVDESDVAVEKLKDDLRSEIRQLRAEISELKRVPTDGEEKPLSGRFRSQIMFGNLITRNTSLEGEYAPVGPIVRYRLETAFSKSFGDSARMKINIDTMDSGFGGGSSDLSTNILDVQGDLRLDVGFENPVNVRVTSGPGPVVHTEEANAQGNYIARSENGVVYVRPWNSIMFSTRWSAMDIGLGYIARKINTFGEVGVNQISATIGYDFPGLYFIPTFKLDTNIDYLSSSPQATPAGPTDTKVTLNALFNPMPRQKANIIYSAGQGASPHNAMFGIGVSLMDIWDTGTTLSLRYKKVGSEYLYENAVLDEDLFAGLDVFNRYIGNGNGLGVVNVGGELSQVITESVNLFSRTDWRLASDNAYDKDNPQCALTIDAGFNWNVATDTVLEAFYRVESIPSAADQSSDLTAFSLEFKY